jgi:hypothetical protein
MPNPYYWKKFQYLHFETFHGLILMWLCIFILWIYLQSNTNQSFIYLWLLRINVIVLHHAFLKFQWLHSVVYQNLHWLMLCYYMKITRHHCYTLPLCRLDFSNDSDECPELNADPATNQCLVWMNDAIVHLHIHAHKINTWINTLQDFIKLYSLPQIH